MDLVGLRELRQYASDLVRRVERGEEIGITVSGRTAACLVPATPRTWREWQAVEKLFSGAEDSTWDSDRDLIDHDIRDPWERR